MSTGTLLGVWAHPDDEAYLSAGLMDEARRRGERVVVVTATAGERGTDDPGRWPPDVLAIRRRTELRAALAAVGVDELHLLGVPDGGCADVDASSRVAEIVDAVRPDTIVTFGPDGMTGHPDHRAVSAWTTAAWQWAGGGARLWYATLTPSFHRRWGDLNDQLGLWSYTEDPPCTDPHDLAHLLDLGGAALSRKVAALRAHASQTDGLVRRVGARTFRSWWRTEAFVDAARVPATVPTVGARS
jgi:LmbE family N-acetylglucosaminyl deacetylase